MSHSSKADERLLHIQHDGAITHIRLNRAEKRNAISDGLIALLHTSFVNLPQETRVVVISGEGDHFCAGLDLAEVSERSVAEGILHSRSWHAAFQALQFGRVPVISVLHGAVVGEDSNWPVTHIRIAETSAFYGLPEGRGASSPAAAARPVPRLIGGHA
jgi:enoyl-CoA hydratase/carnithine racemase